MVLYMGPQLKQKNRLVQLDRLMLPMLRLRFLLSFIIYASHLRVNSNIRRVYTDWTEGVMAFWSLL